MRHGDAVSLTPQLRRLVGLLVTADGATVPAERIADHVADGRTDGSVIRTAVSRLRKSLGDRIETTANGYRLVVDSGELDADRFVELCELARTAAPVDRRALLTEALGLWRGPHLRRVRRRAVGDRHGEPVEGDARRCDGGPRRGR